MAFIGEQLNQGSTKGNAEAEDLCGLSNTGCGRQERGASPPLQQLRAEVGWWHPRQVPPATQQTWSPARIHWPLFSHSLAPAAGLPTLRRPTHQPALAREQSNLIRPGEGRTEHGEGAQGLARQRCLPTTSPPFPFPASHAWSLPPTTVPLRLPEGCDPAGRCPHLPPRPRADLLRDICGVPRNKPMCSSALKVFLAKPLPGLPRGVRPAPGRCPGRLPRVSVCLSRCLSRSFSRLSWSSSPAECRPLSPASRPRSPASHRPGLERRKGSEGLGSGAPRCGQGWVLWAGTSRAREHLSAACRQSGTPCFRAGGSGGSGGTLGVQWGLGT